MLMLQELFADSVAPQFSTTLSDWVNALASLIGPERPVTEISVNACVVVLLKVYDQSTGSPIEAEVKGISADVLSETPPD